MIKYTKLKSCTKQLSKFIALFLLIQIIGNNSLAQSNFKHDYSQTLVMKLGISVPDQKGGTRIINTFEDALEIIKKADKLSLGVAKIIYLVGWQYNGHDDKYPAFFEVNKAMKRKGDKTAEESLMWLMREARKYNTTVSLHINMTDAYDDSPLWDSYVKNDLLAKKQNGKLKVIGNYNSKKAYQIIYKNEWEAGYTQMRIDSLLKLLPPLKEAGTIHVDAWIARGSKGHHVSKKEEQKYQKKAAAYWQKQGIDITSEWVMDYMLGFVPFAWHFNKMDQAGYLKNPANVYTGSSLNPDLKRTDFALGFLFGKSMYGETVFPSLHSNKRVEEWEKLFAKDFYLNCLQYFYLNKLKRLKVEGKGKNRIAYFSENVKVSLADSTVTKGNYLLRKNNFVVFPVVWKKEKVLATYSLHEITKDLVLPDSWSNEKEISIYSVTEYGENFIRNIAVKNNRILITMQAGVPYLIKPKSID